LLAAGKVARCCDENHICLCGGEHASEIIKEWNGIPIATERGDQFRPPARFRAPRAHDRHFGAIRSGTQPTRLRRIGPDNRGSMGSCGGHE
jgi:hypothetical protein